MLRSQFVLDRSSMKANAHRLRTTRLILGLTEQEAAGAFGVSLRTYRRYESGGASKSMAPFIRFAEKYDVSLSWLIFGESAGVGAHLAKHAKGNLAILPALGPFHRWSIKGRRKETPPESPAA